MQTTYRLNAQELSLVFVQSVKTLFVGQEIEITVKSLNEKPLDDVSVLSQAALSEEWESPEDQRWDNLL
ncbi:MAG: hypothetical protein ACK4GN_04175 [Runella sp.]